MWGCCYIGDRDEMQDVGFCTFVGLGVFLGVIFACISRCFGVVG